MISSIKHKSLALLVSLTLGLTALYLSLAVIISFVIEDVILSKLLQKHAHYAEQQYQISAELPDLKLGFIQLYEDPSLMPHELYESIKQSFGDQEIFTPDNTHYHFKTLDLGNEQFGKSPVDDIDDLSDAFGGNGMGAASTPQAPPKPQLSLKTTADLDPTSFQQKWMNIEAFPVINRSINASSAPPIQSLLDAFSARHIF